MISYPETSNDQGIHTLKCKSVKSPKGLKDAYYDCKNWRKRSGFVIY